MFRIKVKVFFPSLNAKNAYGGTKVWFHSFLTSVLHEGRWSTSRPG